MFLLVLLLPMAFAQVQPSSVCNLIPLESKIDVLIQQNSNLREQFATVFDQNHYDAVIGSGITKAMTEESAKLDTQMTTLFVGMAMLLIGIMTLMYWFVLSKLKKAIVNAR